MCRGCPRSPAGPRTRRPPADRRAAGCPQRCRRRSTARRRRRRRRPRDGIAMVERRDRRDRRVRSSGPDVAHEPRARGAAVARPELAPGPESIAGGEVQQTRTRHEPARRRTQGPALQIDEEPGAGARAVTPTQFAPDDRQGCGEEQQAGARREFGGIRGAGPRHEVGEEKGPARTAIRTPEFGAVRAVVVGHKAAQIAEGHEPRRLTGGGARPQVGDRARARGRAIADPEFASDAIRERAEEDERSGADELPRGSEDSRPGARSRTITVPASLPSLRHSSMPCSLRAANSRNPPSSTIPSGLLFTTPPPPLRTSRTSDGSEWTREHGDRDREERCREAVPCHVGLPSSLREPIDPTRTSVTGPTRRWRARELLPLHRGRPPALVRRPRPRTTRQSAQRGGHVPPRRPGAPSVKP